MEFFSGKNILVISPEGWGKSLLSKHYYATELAKNNRVWFLNPPHEPRIDEFHPDGTPAGLRVISDQHIRGLRRLPARIQRFLISRQIDQLEKRVNVKFDLVWNFDNSRYFHHDLFYDAFTIHHVVDEHMNYNLPIATQSADLCLGVTQDIVMRMKEFNPRTYFIQHAFSPFEKTNIMWPQPHPGLRVAYVGNLMLPVLDVSLLSEAATALPDVSFCLIGSIGGGNLNASQNEKRKHEIDFLKTHDNVHLTGELAPADAFTLASQADVQIIPNFRSEKSGTNSSKLPFYFYNGKVIVCNTLSEFAPSDLLRMCDHRDAFIPLLKNTLENITLWNHPEKMNRRTAYATANTYALRLEQIENLITDTDE